MSSNYINRILALFLFILIGLFSSDVYSQDRVLPLADMKNYSGNGGIYYYLPRTVIKVKVQLLKTDYYKGPYSAFAKKYLGSDDMIQYDFTKYEIGETEISYFTEADPDNVYFIEIKDVDSKEDQDIIMNFVKCGMISAINNESWDAPKSSTHISKEIDKIIIKENENGRDDIFNQFLISKYQDSFDTIIKIRTIDDTTTIEEEVLVPKIIEKTNEQIAVELSQQLSRLRTDRSNLLVGYQEVAYSRETLEFMYDQLDKMENDIIEMFLGTSILNEEYVTFSFTPESAFVGAEKVIFKFSDTKGILDKGSGEGESVKLSFNNSGISEKMSEFGLSNSSNEGYYYRYPVFTNISLSKGDSKLAEKRLPIEQFGNVLKLPPNKAKVIYHNGSGGIKAYEVIE